jgi:hypothetical protein
MCQGNPRVNANLNVYCPSIRSNWQLTLVLILWMLSSFACTARSEDVAVVGEVTIAAEDALLKSVIIPKLAFDPSSIPNPSV